MPVVFRFIKSSETLLSITFNKDPEELYCYVNIMTVPGTLNWEKFTQLIAQRYLISTKQSQEFFLL